MASAVDICNIALGRIGQGQFITALTGTTAEAQACRIFYPGARDTTLSRLWWQFATGRKVLATLALERTNWEFVYGLPGDCLDARYLVVEGVAEPRPDERKAFALENDATAGRVLLTNEEEAELVYTRKVEDPTLFSPLFADAVAWKLASDLCLRIPVKPQVGRAMVAAYEAALSVAGANDLNQAQRGPPPQASYIRARSGR